MTLYRFELHLYFKQKIIQFSLVFFMLAGLTTFDRVAYNSKEIADSPYMIAQIIVFVNLFIPLFLLIFSNLIQMRDKNNRVTELMYATGCSLSTLLTSRFLGLVTIGLAISLLFSTTMWLRIQLPVALDANIAAQPITTYWAITAVFSLPTIIFFSTIFTYATNIFKSPMQLISLGIIIYVTYFILLILIGSPLIGGTLPAHSFVRELSSVLDPFAITSFFQITEFWSNNARNIQQIPLGGSLLINRLFWTIIAGLILLRTLTNNMPFLSISAKKKSVSTHNENTVKLKIARTNAFEAFSINTIPVSFQSFIQLVKLEITLLVNSVHFIILLVLWAILVLADLSQLGEVTKFSHGLYPTAANVLDRFQHQFLPRFGLFTIVFYCAEVMWRERQHNVDQLIDALPVSNTLIYGAKFFALSLIPFALTLAAILVSIGVQLNDESVTINFAAYLGVFYFSAIPLLLKIAVCMLIHILVRNKYIGLIFSLLFLLLFGTNMNVNFGLEQPLWRITDAPNVVFSDINSYDLTNDAYLLYMIYWSTFIGLLSSLILTFSHATLQKGVINKLKYYYTHLTKTQASLLVILLFSTITSGSLIYYRSTVEADYLTKEQQIAWRADYEKQFKKYQTLAQPTLIKITNKVDIKPSERKYKIQGVFTYENKSTQAISEIMIYLDPRLSSSEIELQDASIIHASTAHGTQIFKLTQPLLPRQQLKLNFTISEQQSGFKKTSHKNKVVKNGSFIFASELMPQLGYLQDIELKENKYRERYQLSLSDVSTKGKPSSKRVSFINFSSVVSTQDNQTAIAPGELISQWKKGKTSYFHYKSAAPIRNSIVYLSAHYKMEEEIYNGVKLQLFYHKEHSANIKGMMSVIKQSFMIFEQKFGLYPHKTFRQVETANFTGLTGYAAPTITLMSEGAGFTDIISNGLTFNDAYRRTIHELSHQWWAHQIAPDSNKDGSMLLVESLAKYSELIVLEKMFSKRAATALVDYEIARYFKGQTRERFTEKPLNQMTDYQVYLAYSKGTFAMHRLKNLLGEHALNNILKALIEKFRYAPLTLTANSFISALYQHVPNHKTKINEIFEQVTYYRSKNHQANALEVTSENWQVNLSVEIEKLQIDLENKEKNIDFKEVIEISLIYDNNKSREKETVIMAVKPGQNELTLALAEKPDAIIFDISRKLLDKDLHRLVPVNK